MKKKCCQFCGSENLIRDAKLLASLHPVFVVRNARPDAVLFKEPRQSRTKLLVCGDCGYLHTFVADPERLQSGIPRVPADSISPSDGKPIQIRSVPE